MINTKQVQGRRELHFANFDELRTDVERLVASPNLRALGNWSLGRALGHLAIGMNLAIDGNNIARPPLLIRLFAPLFKKQVLKKMSPGFRLPKLAEARMVPEANLSMADGLQSFMTALKRLQTDPHRAPGNFLGKLSKDQWDRLQLSHAEMHLSFFVP